MTEHQTIAAGSYVRIRDEDWLVTDVRETSHDGLHLICTGASALVETEVAEFFTALDRPTVLKPEHTRLVDDLDSARYADTRLYLEAVMRRAAVPRSETGLALADRALLNRLDYQRRPAEMALANLRPRLLIADVVGLGKTLEIGLLLAELIRRGRGDRVLVVVPQQVLDQFQRELWTRFSIPLLAMDSEGIARVQRSLPAGRNPFDFHRRIIISIDTLKSDRYRQHLEKVTWDAVVFDESHNLIGSAGATSLRSKLAKLVADTTEALIFASATPHPGKDRAFAELIDMLDPTRIADPGDYTAADIEGLYIRRTKTDSEVKAGLQRSGGKWAPRGTAEALEVAATEAEEAVFDELADSWLRPDQIQRADRSLFAYTLLKAFFSSPAALTHTVDERRKKRRPEEAASLERLARLADAIARPAKLDALLTRLRSIGIGPSSAARVVIFSERNQTLEWLADRVRSELGMKAGQVRTLHGTTPDKEAVETVEQFGLGSSPLRVLVTGDIASEGVNLHKACHHLVHWDLPWSLIRIEQRNGRIDRYGQTHAPEFAALMLRSANARDWDESRVATALLEKEQQASTALGSVEAQLGHSDANAEEDRLVRDILSGRARPEAAIEAAAAPAFSLASLLNRDVNPAAKKAPPRSAEIPGLFSDTDSFIRTALASDKIRGALTAAATDDGDLLLTNMPEDLLSRLTRVLPPQYVNEQRLTERLHITTDKTRALRSLERAQEQGSSAWPNLCYLGDLHPVVEWLTDRAILAMGRDRAPVIRAEVPGPVYCIEGVYTNRLGQSAVVEWMAVLGVGTGAPQVAPLVDFLKRHGVDDTIVNPGKATPEDLRGKLESGLPEALEEARTYLDQAKTEWSKKIREHLATDTAKVGHWEQQVLIGLEQRQARRRKDEDRARNTARTQRERIAALDVTGEPMLRVVATVIPAGA